ncbi:MAG: CapA family protein [Candidatus Shapirobacteria bacterium]|nr:CapA family protein [Candidatus Shapirobacteria bacterium]
MKLRVILLTVFLVITSFFIVSFKLTPSNIISPASIGSFKKVFIPTPIPTSTVKFGLVGDLGLGRYITNIARSKNDFSWSFSEVSHILQANDFNLANLESPIIKDCPTGFTGTFTFCGDPRFLLQLKSNKFILNLANNHMFNYGQDGFNQTKSFLNQQNINFVYSHNSDSEFVSKEINGIKFGFLGYDFISNPKLDPNQIINLIKKYNSQVDWLILSLHWGNEYLSIPEEWRVDLAHQFIDAGADIIHGHHPHVLQPSEIYQGKPIYYSLGNFIFDQNWSVETSISQIIDITVTKNEIIKTASIPLIIKYNSQPQPSI